MMSCLGHLGKLVGGELGSGLLCKGLGVGVVVSWGGVAGSGFINGASCLAGGGGGEVGDGGGSGKEGRQGAARLEEDDIDGGPGPVVDDEAGGGAPGDGAVLDPGWLARDPVLEVSLRPRPTFRVSHNRPPVLLQEMLGSS